MQKKVAGIPRVFNWSRSLGVNTGSGPSSKVMETTFSSVTALHNALMWYPDRMKKDIETERVMYNEKRMI
jgi:hypothetical protein